MTTETTGALATIETTNFALVFVPGGVEKVVARIEREAREEAAQHDPTKPKGRAALTSLGYKVAQSKTAIDDGGKKLKAEYTAKIAPIDDDRRDARARLDALKAEIVAPVEAYKHREAVRVAGHETAIEAIVNQGIIDASLDSAAIAILIDGLEDIHATRQWDEFAGKAHKAREEVRERLRAAYQTAKTSEDEAEAERLRLAEEAEAARLAEIEARRVREEAIALEAAAEAKRLAEEHAETARLAAEAQAERKRAEEAAAAQALLDAAEAREREAAAALERAKAERLAGIERERVAAEKRVADLKQRIEAIKESPEWGPTESSRDIKRRIEYLQNIRQADFDELSNEAHEVRAAELQRAEQFLVGALALEEKAERKRQRAEYHQSMLHHVKNCGFGFIGPDPQPVGLLQYELTEKIEYNEDNFGELLPQALVARDAALASIQKSIDEKVAALEAERQAERRRLALETETQRKADEARAADKAHRGKVNREAMEDIAAIILSLSAPDGTSEPLARAIVTALAKGEIRNCRVVY